MKIIIISRLTSTLYSAAHLSFTSNNCFAAPCRAAGPGVGIAKKHYSIQISVGTLPMNTQMMKLSAVC